MILIGCDPGVTGGLALFVGTELTDVKDIPNCEIVTDAKGAAIRDLIGGPKQHKSHRLNPQGLSDLLRDWAQGHSARLIREDVRPRGGQGAVSQAVMMEAVGLIDGVCAAIGIRVEKVDPSTWKRAMGLTDKKAMSCQRAIDLFPKWKTSFKRTSIDDDRAEAALIGLYGLRTLPLI